MKFIEVYGRLPKTKKEIKECCLTEEDYDTVKKVIQPRFEGNGGKQV